MIDHLARALAKPRAVAANTSSVRKAAAKLNEITGSTNDAQIVRAGGVLGVDDEVLQVAKELRRFRNHRLGHPGHRVDARELEAWLKPGTGRGAAVHFWNRYLVWIAAGRPNNGVPTAV